MLKALLLSSLAFNTGLLLGRISGFVREAFVATTYGATAEADIVVLMLTVPDFLVNILVGGALGAVLVPEFSQHREQSRHLLYQSMLFFGFIFICLAAILYWQSELLVALLMPGFSENQAAKAAIALGWVIWLVPLTVLAGVVTAYLHAQNKFSIAALGTLIVNSTIIVGLLLVYLDLGDLQLVAYFILLGGVLRLFSQMLQTGFVKIPLFTQSRWLLNKGILVHYGQAMLSGGMLLLFPVIARALASFEESGSVAIFNYATRLIEFPLVIAVTFLTAVFFPSLAQSFIQDKQQHRQLIRYGVQITLGFSLTAFIILASLSYSYADCVYGHGDMNSVNVMVVANLTSIGLAALPLQGLSTFLTSVFNARKNTLTPLILNLAGIVFFLVSTNIGVFGEGLQSLMLGLVASYGLICIMQLVFLRIDAFSWWKVLFDREYFPGLVFALVLTSFIAQWISLSTFTSWLSLFLALILALGSLIVMAVFNSNIRSVIKIWIQSK